MHLIFARRDLGTFIVAVLTVLVFDSVLSQDANCDFSQKIEVGRTYYVSSPNYPSSYNQGSTCRWVATCPTGYNCALSCSEVNIPQSTGCSGDRLLVSRTGDLMLNGAQTYCGQGTLNAVSSGTTMSIGLITTSSSSGGRFSCSVKAQAAAAPTCSCGYKKASRIVGGQETQVNEYPMMAGLYDSSIGEIYCGAVIIWNHYLLTAAHCLAGRDVSTLQVVVGEHNTETTGETGATQRLAVQDFLIHPNFNAETYDYDIALVLTASDIQFSGLVGPVCLPFKFAQSSLQNAAVTILGWGTQSIGGPDSNVLQKVDVSVISQSSCRQSISTLTDRQVCTYTQGKDACQNDSGGPVLYTDPSTGLLVNVGIVSFGRFCASGTPAVNTRVASLLDWITANTADASYCRP